MQFIQADPFQPAFGLSHPHGQTIGGFIFRPRHGIQYRRVRLDTPDGDFVDIDFPHVQRYSWLWTELGDNTPLVLVLHGLEGSARGVLAQQTYRELARQGIRAVGLNFRSCSGEMNRTHTLYHSGATEDVELVLNWLETAYPEVPKGLVGFSLGGNVTLKYMGTGANHIQAAVSISPPFDLGRGSAVLDSSGQFYMRAMLRSLKQKARLMRPLLEEKIDVDALLATETFRAFDDIWQPLNGFADADDYYRQCSSKNFLPTISHPTLIMRSLDDPFFDPDDVPYQRLENPQLQTLLTAHGGHGGFLERASGWRIGFWAERQAARFLAAVLKKRPFSHQPTRSVPQQDKTTRQ